MIQPCAGNGNGIKEKIAKALLLGAAVAVFSSIFFPWWYLVVKAPQYPKGLRVHVYLDHVTGDVREIDTLNHYIGMRPLAEAAKLEKQFALPGMAIVIVCLVLSIFVRGRISILLILPAIVLPAIFAADLYLWLRDFGLHLNPRAPLSSSVKPFVPPLLGQGKIAQFQASANFAFGHGLSMLSAIFSLAVLILRFRGKKSPISRQTIPTASVLLLLAGVIFCRPALAETLTVGDSFYPTIQSAIESAKQGDTILVKRGVYHGPLVVQKSLKLIGEDSPVIDGGGKGTVIQLDAPDVLLQGFVIQNSGDILSSEDGGVVALKPGVRIENNRFQNVLFGIYLRRAPNSVIRQNVLTGKPLAMARRGDLIRVWYSDDVLIEDNQVTNGRDVVLWFSKNLKVRANLFQKSRYGLHFMYCREAVVQDNHLSHNSVGAYLMYSAGLRLTANTLSDNRGPSGYGVGFKDMEEAVLERNVISGNRVGFFLDGCSKGISRENLIIYNEIGMELFPSSRNNVFENNNLIENNEQVTMDSSSTYTVNQWSGNYWSDYRGYDANQDGIGDLPYQPMRFFERLTDRFHDLKVFFASPSVHAVDFAAATFPVFAPVSKFRDEKPRTQPIPIPLSAGQRPESMAWTLVSLGLLLPLAGFFRHGSGCCQIKSSSGSADPSKSGMPAIRIRSLTKYFKKVCALSSVDLEIQTGEVVALWGPNGAGKTTLLRCLLGIISFEGDIYVLGKDVKKNGKEVRRQVGYVPQEIRLHLDQTIWQTVVFYARLRRTPVQTAEKLMKAWGLESSRNQLAQNLSGGMKQKLALVIALLSDPPILFLDEPTSNLDVRTRHEFDSVIQKLKNMGKTLIFCSHRYSEVKRNADRVILLESGFKKMEGNADSVKEAG